MCVVLRIDFFNKFFQNLVVVLDFFQQKVFFAFLVFRFFRICHRALNFGANQRRHFEAGKFFRLTKHSQSEFFTFTKHSQWRFRIIQFIINQIILNYFVIHMAKNALSQWHFWLMRIGILSNHWPMLAMKVARFDASPVSRPNFRRRR